MSTKAREQVRSVSREPEWHRLRNPAKRYLLATRPPFLSLTVLGCLLGLASATADGVPLQTLLALTTVVLALLIHAGVNVHNDYCDHLNGSDARNTERIFPFTGGSRFIQNGVLSAAATQRFAFALFASAIIGGLALVLWVGWGLLLIGMLGLLTGFAYSAEPLRLNSRGLGEICVVLSFSLVVVGADFVQRGAFAPTPFWAGLSYALLTCNVLYINQFPDRAADLAAGKCHWVARLPVAQARWGYVLILAFATLAIVLPVMAGALPVAASAGLLALVPASLALRQLWAFAGQPAALAPALRLTIVAAHLGPLAMCLALVAHAAQN